MIRKSTSRYLVIFSGILSATVLVTSFGCDRSSSPIQSEFARAVDLAPLSKVAVQHSGRLKSFDSYARTIMGFISGPKKINNQPAAFTYLDLMIRPDAYQDADIIYVRKKPIRRRIAERLASDPTFGSEDQMRFLKTGLISRSLLARADVQNLLDEMDRNLIRTSKFVQEIRGSVGWSSQQALAGNLRIIPPPVGDPQSAWHSAMELLSSGAPSDNIHAGMGMSGRGIPGLDPQLQSELTQTWFALESAWGSQNPHRVNESLAKLSTLLPQVNPALYPKSDKLELESWYFRYHGLVWTWAIYLLAVIPLLLSTVYHWPVARRLGLMIFVIAFALHTYSIGIRWYLADRIPNANMYEAIIAATWFGGVLALLLEWMGRNTPMRNLFAIGASICAMAAMMSAHFLPTQLDSSIGNVMPVLNDVWLYIHTNVIIASYCIIGMATVTAILYLIYRAVSGDRQYARLGGAGEFMLAAASAQTPAPQRFELAHPPTKSSLENKSEGFRGMWQRRASSPGQVLDGATMVLMELSFVLLWAGIVMGAIWADHSWGRPWGWDPKEVFALNTFIIFLILVHVRLKVRDKALWTAVLACLGCGVMLFNWIIVNFVISGLHSYA